MDGFGDNFDQPEVDPAAEFLAREQDQLAGLEDELNPGSAPPVTDDAAFGVQGSAPLTGSFEMIDNFGQQDGLGPDLLSSATEGVPPEAKPASEPLDAKSMETEAENSGIEDAAVADSYGSVAVAAVSAVDNSAAAGDDCATCYGDENSATGRDADGDGSVAATAPAVEGSASAIVSTVYDDSVTSDAKLQPDGLAGQTKIFSTPTPPKPVVKEEPEKIRKWREEQKKRLEEKDANEEKRKEELREQAKKELEEWYKHHEEQIAKTKAANREAAKNAEKQFVAEAGEIEPGTEWERIAKLCDFNPKSSKTSKDVSRMRSIILQLKQTPPAAKRA